MSKQWTQAVYLEDSGVVSTAAAVAAVAVASPVNHLRWDLEEHDALEDSQGLQGRMDGGIHSHKFTAS